MPLLLLQKDSRFRFAMVSRLQAVGLWLGELFWFAVPQEKVEAQMTLFQMPEEISSLAVAMAQEGLTWSYAEFADGKFKHWDDLTVGDCEQLVPTYIDRARKAIESYQKRPSTKKAKRAAEFIDRARLYRERYHEILKLPHDETEMPFPIMSAQEAAECNQKSSN